MSSSNEVLLPISGTIVDNMEEISIKKLIYGQNILEKTLDAPLRFPQREQNTSPNLNCYVVEKKRKRIELTSG